MPTTANAAPATATLTRPAVAQIDYREDGREVTATVNADGTTTLTLDAGTLATVLNALRHAATNGDTAYRVMEANGRHALDYLGAAATRPRLVVDAVELARYRAGERTSTYDLD